MSRPSRTTFSRSRGPWWLGLGLLCVAGGANAQITTVLTPMPHWTLRWPQTPRQLAVANRLPLKAVASALRSSSSGPGAVPNNLYGFRFAYLERGRVYLVTSMGTRYGWLGTLEPVGDGKFQSTSLPAMPNGSLATSVVDLRGDGVDEVIGLTPVTYRGAFGDPIYWYTIYAFHDGKPEDVSAQFPEFYQTNVLPWLDYLYRVYDWIRHTVPGPLLQGKLSELGPGSPDIELAEIAFVRLKYQHVILGNKNAGLRRALAWVRSRNSQIATLGVRLLAQMTAPAAWAEIHKLWNSLDYMVCSQARAAWLKRIGKPYTEKYECPRPNVKPRSP